MSGLNGHGSPQAGFGPAGLQGASEGDPSMEDILASIRRILSEDETLAEKTGPENAAPEQPAPPPHEVFNLDESMLVAAPKHDAAHRAPAPASPAASPAANPPPPELPAQPVAQAAPTPTPTPTPTPPPPAPHPDADTPGESAVQPPQATPDPGGAPHAAAPIAPLVAQAAGDAASASMGALMRTLAHERQVSLYRGGPTLEDMVREEMRPILKDWLDTNLPAMVERVVRAEIERVTQRAAG